MHNHFKVIENMQFKNNENFNTIIWKEMLRANKLKTLNANQEYNIYIYKYMAIIMWTSVKEKCKNTLFTNKNNYKQINTISFISFSLVARIPIQFQLVYWLVARKCLHRPTKIKYFFSYREISFEITKKADKVWALNKSH